MLQVQSIVNGRVLSVLTIHNITEEVPLPDKCHYQYEFYKFRKEESQLYAGCVSHSRKMGSEALIFKILGQITKSQQKDRKDGEVSS